MSDISVLHVDDDDGFLRMATEYLTRMDQSLVVEGAASAEAGLRALEEGPFDCVVSDSVELADGTPFVVAARERRPELPIVLYTASPADALGADVAAATQGYVRKRTTGATDLVGRTVQNLVGDRGTVEGRPRAVPASDGGLPGEDTSRWHAVRRVDFEMSEGLLPQILAFLEAELGIDPARTAPLYEAVEPEALERLVFHSRQTGENLSVEFHYEGYDLLVTADGIMGLRPADT